MSDGPREQPFQAPVRAWALAAVLGITAVLSYTDRNILALLVEPLRHDLALSDTQLGLLQGGAFALVYSISVVPLGRLADRGSRWSVIICGVLVWSAATSACGFAQSFWALFTARMCVGIGEAALAPAAIALITDRFPERLRGTAISIFMMGMIIGSGGSFAIGGVLYRSATQGALADLPLFGGLASWRQVLLALGAFGPVVAAILFVLRHVSREAGSARTANGRRLSLTQSIQSFGARRIVALMLILALSLTGMGDYTILSWCPAMLERRFGWSTGQVGSALGIVFLSAATVGCLLGGFLGDWLVRRNMPRARLAIAAVAGTAASIGGAIALSRTAVQVLIFAGAWVFFASSAVTSGTTALQGITPKALRGLSSALVALGSVGLGLGVGVVSAGALTDHIFTGPGVGWSITAVVVPAVILANALYWGAFARLRETRSVAHANVADPAAAVRCE